MQQNELFERFLDVADCERSWTIIELPTISNTVIAIKHILDRSNKCSIIAQWSGLGVLKVLNNEMDEDREHLKNVVRCLVPKWASKDFTDWDPLYGVIEENDGLIVSRDDLLVVWDANQYIKGNQACFNDSEENMKWRERIKFVLAA